ncbi:sulfotransferase domain-containing protein [Aquirufa aurantiipilula]|uniref:Sulfotransferase domain-containing protein n=1 Tax=Aquirufa aurantiipilula TaxID=2696561 RepID=A0ABT6BKL1_9BACT|nr:sulfotransferase domain-containing protein [Aquirufa aurantiipilula]MDF5691007.1 sulfotransferase domain-containing protein [Aquirufa aurantiipilula]
METKKNIIWLASYPKSGNTWFRGFITALKNNGEVNINELATHSIFSNKFLVENNLDIDADDIPVSQIDLFKRISFDYISQKSEENIFVKIHDKYTMSKFDHLPIVPEQNSLAAIYFVRNPLDVTISMANHNGQSIDQVIDKVITNPHAQIAKNKERSKGQFVQFIGSWNDHVMSWKKVTEFPVYFVRFEDLKCNPLDTFTTVLKQIEYDANEAEIKAAIEATRFEKLKKQELEYGFVEKPISSKRFFNKGEIGQWREQLSKEQIHKIKQFNEPMMREFGYWEN